MGTSSPPQKGGRAPSPIFAPFLLWPNGWMHQNATLYGVRPQLKGLCVRCGPSPLPKKGAESPNFCPCLLWPNGWMHKDATWYRSSPRPRPHYIRRGSQLSAKGHSSPPVFGPCLLWLRSPILATAELLLKQFALCYRTVACLSVCLSVLSCPVYMSVCNVGVLWPNGLTDQAETWHAGTPKGAQPPQPPNFRPISVAAKWLHRSRFHLVWR